MSNLTNVETKGLFKTKEGVSASSQFGDHEFGCFNASIGSANMSLETSAFCARLPGQQLSREMSTVNRPVRKRV